MKRWVFNLAAAGSLLICMAVAVLWARSLMRFDDLCWTKPTRCINVVSLRGRLHIQAASASGPLWDTSQQWDAIPVKDVGYNSGPYRYEFFGFAKGLHTNKFGKIATSERVYVVPYWFMLLVSAPLPVLWARQTRRKRLARRRAAQGLCVRCGYDLRATTARCPECGAEPVAGAPASP